MLTGFFVAARIIANPVSNVFQKQLTQRSANPIFIIGATHALLTLGTLPILWAASTPASAEGFWTNIVLCAMLAVVGNALLVYALKWSDLSVLGPINAYKAVISLVLGVFLIGEFPTPIGLAGVFLILIGSYFIVDRLPTQSHQNALVQFMRERGIQLRFAALGLSATEAVFLKKALLLSSPLTTFVWWSILGLPFSGVVILLFCRKKLVGEFKVFFRHWRAYLWLAGATGLMQLTTLLTFEKLHVGYSLALFQLSAVISVFLGYHYFQEANIRRRLLGSIVMALGAALIVIFGGDTTGRP
jgi:drug/metabolite transporter (DMT)-like permease